jgi:DNA-binding CsgD family transcriptional regulator
MSPRARALLGHGPLAPSLVFAARRLAQTVLARAVEAAPLELRVHFKVDARVAVDAELSIARTLSGERIVAVGLEQTDPPRAQVAAAAMRFALTVAEADVLAMMANGLSNAAIARRFGIALPTVKTHVHRVIQKMAVTSRLQAVLLARKLN